MPDAYAPSIAREDLESWRLHADANRFTSDAFLQRVLRRYFAAEAGRVFAVLEKTADASGSVLDSLVDECNRNENLPRLRNDDRFGRPTAEVVFHPTHHEVGRVFWGSRVLSVLAEPGNELLAGAIAYLLDQNGEAGHACPVACTAGAIKLIQRVGSEEQKRRFLPALLDPDYERRLHAAQFVTEIQGGSDVGVNACVATPDPERPGFYRLTGEKWFCSVADAGLFVVSARPEGAAGGTRGLGLFLVQRTLEGAPNGFRLRRLKEKLGTRSMPTGEIEFDGALAEPIGPIDQGFKNLVAIVLDTSRVHNALAACGIMRRAFVESIAYAKARRAFGRSILEFPAVRSTLARMRLRNVTALASTFRILAMTDRLDAGDEGELEATRRIAVMINKYWTALGATASSRDGIELLGGNGAVEEFSVLPRLYRDAIVIESWEGTHNTLCAQVVRDFAVRRLHEPWLAAVEAEIRALANRELADVAGTACDLLSDVEDRIERLLAVDEDSANAVMRPVVDRMCRLTDWVALASQLQWEKEARIESDTGLALALYRASILERQDPQDVPELIDIEGRFAGGMA